ncbi:MAG: ABC transporter substrate-binding protein [Paludibacter sp.]|nr:ABC transporter substrate-binding protein [Paludibacter sp.]
MNKSIKYILVLLAIIVIAVAVSQFLRKEKSNVKVGVVYLMEHPSITEGLDGLKSQLDSIENETGLKFDVTYQNAFGEMINIEKIVKSFKDNNVDVILALTTPCAKVAQNQFKDKPIIFVGVTDPVADKLVDNLNFGKGNITGTTSKVPSTKILQFALELFPEIKKVGVLYSTGENNSIAILTQLESDIRTFNLPIELVKKGVTATVDIQKIAESTMNETDALFVINDNGIVSSVNILIKATDNAHKPIFASDIQSVKQGALFTFGLNYKDEGIAAANILKEIIIENKKPSEIPVFVNQKDYFVVNRKLFKEFKVDSLKVSNAIIVE